jgi:Fur family transcriptional regulator, ferric uptake regulator
MIASNTADKYSSTGPRLTKGCKSVLTALQNTRGLHSAQEIHGLLRTDSNSPPGLTTVYRSLESLVELELIQAVDLGDGEKRYEVVEPGHHHHHLVCKECKRSVHLDQCMVEDLLSAIESQYGFVAETHVLEIFGTCKKCNRKK